MILPKLNRITYSLRLPSNDKEIVFRPFTVEEEKILLTAQESTESADILRAMRQIINNCVQTEINVMKLPTFDIEYFFLNIRAKSTGEEIELLLKHPMETNSKGEQCEYKEKAKISIEDIKVSKPENTNNKFQLDENVGVFMRYPTIESVAVQADDDFDAFIKLIANCIETIYDKEGTYNSEDVSNEELIKFVYSMNQNQIGQIQEFFDNMPVLTHTVNYICSQCGCKEKVTIEGFQNFFL